MNAQEKISKIIKAFEDKNFQKSIEKEAVNIREELSNTLNKVEQEKEFVIATDISSRIKDPSSLKEKITRKNLITILHDQDDEKIQENIMERLDDLIGFRVNCYFWNDEEVVYKKFKKLLSENEILKCDFKDDQLQKNGKEIFKFTGKISSDQSTQVCFEVQIKSFLHELWGEVEHKTMYKSKVYDSTMIYKREIEDKTYNILRAIDSQLRLIYNESENTSNRKKKMLNEFFYINTIEDYNKKTEVEVINPLPVYSVFFNLKEDWPEVKERFKFFSNPYYEEAPNELETKVLEQLDIYENFNSYHEKNINDYLDKNKEEDYTTIIKGLQFLLEILNFNLSEGNVWDIIKVLSYKELSRFELDEEFSSNEYDNEMFKEPYDEGESDYDEGGIDPDKLLSKDILNKINNYFNSREV